VKSRDQALDFSFEKSQDGIHIQTVFSAAHPYSV
jgi:hypothetical protein